MRKYLFLCMALVFLVSCSKKDENHKKTIIKNDYLWDLSSIEVDNLDFGLVEENESKILSVSIHNTTSETIAGPIVVSHEKFSLLYSNCVELAPGQKCVAKIGFTAQGELDNYSANISLGVHSNILFGAIDRKSETLMGFYNNNTPLSYFDLGNLNYYNMVIKTFKIKNTGELSINHQLETLNQQVSIIYDKCSGVEIKPQQHCLFKILFSGVGKNGLITDTIKFGSMELQLQSNVLNFEALKLASEIELIYNQQLVSSVLDIGTINLGDSVPFNFFLKNIGQEAGQVDSVNTGAFLEVQNLCDNTFLIPNDYCRVRSLIKPETKGVFSNNITAMINQVNQDYVIQGIVRSPGDKITCSSQIDFAESAFITWDGSSYSSCVVEECLDYYSLSNNTCNYIIPQAQALAFNLSEDNALENQSFSYSTITGQGQVEIVSNPTNGIVSLNNGQFSYVPNLNFQGGDSFSYRIFDGNEYSQPVVVTLSVAGVNDAPVSENLTASTNEDIAVNLNLVASDIENDSLSYSIVSAPSSGTLSGTAPNYVYTPNSNFNGVDSFTFKVNDGTLDSNVATVNIEVLPINDAPVLAGTTSLTMDINNSGSGSISVSDIDSSSFTYNITQGNKGILSLNSTSGAITYIPNNNAYGTDTVSIVASDGINNSNTLSISVTIVGTGIILTADGSRTYFDGSVQKNCYNYKNTNSGTKVYAGSTGSGVYKIQSGAEIVNVYCDQDTDGGGWTLAVKVGDYANISSYSTLSTGPVNIAGLTNPNVLGIGVTYSKLSDSMLNSIKTSTATNFAAIRMEKINGNFNASYRKLFYPGSCTWAVRGANIASVAPECTKRASVYTATSFTQGGDVSWCNQPNMTRHYLCSNVHEGFTIVTNYESSENHNIPHHRIWIR